MYMHMCVYIYICKVQVKRYEMVVSVLHDINCKSFSQNCETGFVWFVWYLNFRVTKGWFSYQ